MDGKTVPKVKFMLIKSPFFQNSIRLDKSPFFQYLQIFVTNAEKMEIYFLN